MFEPALFATEHKKATASEEMALILVITSSVVCLGVIPVLVILRLIVFSTFCGET